MAVLTDIEHDEVSFKYQGDLSRVLETLAGVTKADIKAAVVAVDQWVNDNKESFNTALPVATRTNLSAAQKSQLLVYVVERRFQEGE